MTGLKTDLQVQDIQLDLLINQGQYARLTKFLLDLQRAVEPTDQSNLKNLTATALQICLFCQQCQTEMEWHRKADREVRLRLKELDGQLETLLNLIVEHESQKETQHPAISVSVTLLEDRITPMVREHPNLWQRIRDLFNFEPKPHHSERQMTEVVVNTSFPSSVEKNERVIDADNINDELPIFPTKGGVVSALSNVDRNDGSRTTLKEEESNDNVMSPAVAVPNRKRDDASATPIEESAQSQDTPPSLMIYCLGSFRVYQNDQLVQEWPSSKGKSIFKYLVAQRKHPVPKEVLMELFWPGAHPDAARNNLNVSIYGLRQALRNISPNFSHILFQEESYLLNPVMDLWTDIEEFTSRIKLGRQNEKRGNIHAAILKYQTAEALYQGEFLAEDRYEDWLINQRLSLQDDYLKLLDHLSEHYIEWKDFSACVAVCNKMLAVDPCGEEAHQQLMRCYSCQGQPYLALRQFHMCEEALKSELDLPPSPETKDLYWRIRAGKQLSVASV